MEIIFVRTTKENLLYREKDDVKMKSWLCKWPVK